MAFNVLDYGATGENVALDTAAFQAAFDAVAANGGGQVLVPCLPARKRYKVSQVNLNPLDDIEILGAGYPKIFLTNPPNTNGLYIGSPTFQQSFVALRGLHIVSDRTNGNGLRVENISDLTVEDCSISGHGQIGYFPSDTYTMLVRNTVFNANGTGAYATKAAGNGSRFDHCSFGNNAIGLFLDGSAGRHYGTLITSPTMEYNGKGIVIAGASAVSIVGGYAEFQSDIVVDVWAGVPNEAVSISGISCFDKGFRVRGTNGVRINGNNMRNGSVIDVYGCSNVDTSGNIVS